MRLGGCGGGDICIGHPMTLSQEEYEECRLAFNKFGTGCIAIATIYLRAFDRIDADIWKKENVSLILPFGHCWAHARMLAYPYVRHYFSLFRPMSTDQDGSGKIDVPELRATLQALGQHPTDEELFLMISSGACRVARMHGISHALPPFLGHTLTTVTRVRL